MATTEITAPWQRVVIMRHAQSVNVTRWLERREGQPVSMVDDADDHLTVHGQSQTQQATHALLKILQRPPHNHRKTIKVYSSPSTRCRETANIVAKLMQVAGWTHGSIEFADQLQELRARDYVASATAALSPDDQIEAWNRLVFDPNNLDGHTVRLVITHGNILKTALARRWGWSPQVSLAPALTSLTVLDYNAAGQTVVHNLCDSSAQDHVRQWFNTDLFAQ